MTANGERSFSAVLEGIAGNVQGIIRSEVRLAKAEIREEAGKAGTAARVLGIGALLGLYAAGFLLLAAVHALEQVVEPWLAALIVSVLAGTAAAILMRAGITRMKRVDPRPDRTIDTIKENIHWAKDQVR